MCSNIGLHHWRLCMKKETHYRIKNLYVGYIALQSNVKMEYVGMHYALSETYFYSWKYAPLKLGIFVKTPFGYKHILTDTYYKTANYKTGGELVIVKANTHKLTMFEPKLCEKLISNNIPYLTCKQISKLENKYNVLFKKQSQKQNNSLEDCITV